MPEAGCTISGQRPKLTSDVVCHTSSITQLSHISVQQSIISHQNSQLDRYFRDPQSLSTISLDLIHRNVILTENFVNLITST